MNSRRQFLKQVSVLTAAAAIPAVAGATSAAPAPRKVKPGKKVRLACVGIGFRGGAIIKKFEETGLCDIVALCDIDMGAPHTLETLERHPDVPRYQDFRKMFKEMGKKIYLLSNYPKEGFEFLSQQKFADRFAIFDGGTISCYCHYNKPEDEIYQELIRACNLTPERTVFIDDTLKNVEGAMKHGIHGYHRHENGMMDRFFI